MVSLKSYRIQLSSASCNYKSKMNFQKTGLFFSKCIVLGARHVWWVWLLWFCTYWNWKNATFPNLQDNIKVIRRYEGWYYTRLVSYYIKFRFENDWSRIRPLPTTTLIHQYSIFTTINISTIMCQYFHIYSVFGIKIFTKKSLHYNQSLECTCTFVN